MKIYTKTGDNGTTSLVYGQRVSKNDSRVDAFGTCDEANSMIGLALSYLNKADFKDITSFKAYFNEIQTGLFHVGAELSTPNDKTVKWEVTQDDIEKMEMMIDRWSKELTPLKNFILPGGHVSGSAFHVARTIVRRAERKAVSLECVNPLVLSYLNRLSDLLFVAARYVNSQLGAPEQMLHEKERQGEG
ncbi:cob(I)yrinic acid a,c-diamide adenosyltransferase [Bacillus chungangensis]|uniref:Corrinoid adenosyltransferase n=1 Tax=Bacillus chungangensis TaxID=587633 RepID=A0ABT9WR04_9BACI|nr:cob(I)yrinic acid a,c-diamide adenosyltransferase [Bacillus chungangensis]MDQ0175719.1 cob(I)alamin adenosyltransferase [Bacillus chungangensis]